MKNILYIGTYNGIIGGIERYIQNSAILLRKNNYIVNYLYTTCGGVDKEIFAKSFDLMAKFDPENLAIKEADIIIIHNIVPKDILGCLPKEKTYFFSHDHNIYCQRHHYYTPINRTNCHRKRNKLLCFLCSLGRNSAPPLEEYQKFPAIVLSNFMKENLEKNNFSKVIKLPPFITSKLELQEDYQVMPNNVLRILFLGQLIRGKGCDLMLETLAKLDIPFTCTIAGDGNDRAMLEKLVDKYNLNNKVKFTGFVSNPEELWANCDIFFFPIRWQEPFGLVGLEALSHKKAVIAFNLGGVEEYLSNDCGRLIPPKNTTQAAKELTNLYNKPQLLKELGNNGYQVVKEKFSPENFLQEFSKLL
jgi:glycosyltransferase involved in cell wall biosynthesis